MEWDDFYERAENWSKSTLSQRISSLKTIGEAWEISDIAELIKDQELNAKLIKKAMSLGAKFPFEDIVSFEGLVSKETICQMIDYALNHGESISADEILGFEGIVDQDTLDMLLHSMVNRKISLNADDLLDLDGVVSKSVIDRAALASTLQFSGEDMAYLENVLSPQVHRALCEKNGLYEVDGEYRKLAKPPAKKNNKASEAKSKGLYEAAQTDSSTDSDIEEKVPGISLWTLLVAMITFPFTLLFKIIRIFAFLSLFSGKKTEEFRVGDPVLVRYSQTEGRIIDINGSLIMVSMYDGGKVDSYQAYELERI
jgi:putative uncharacterized protein (fragment)|nr:hypothetical protein [uncultured Oribacterium sp.]